MTPEAVVFDLDGTLADTVADIAAALNDALATRDYGPIDASDVRLMIGKGPKILVERGLRHLGVYPASTLVNTLTERFVRCYAKQGNQLSSLFGSVAENDVPPWPGRAHCRHPGHPGWPQNRRTDCCPAACR